MGLNFMTPEILDYQLNGHMATRVGNRSRDVAPHGVYPCAGEDQWCAIAVETDAQWPGLRAVLGDPDWARDGDLDTALGRVARQAEIDEYIQDWTRALPPQAVMERLAAAGVPAGVVQRSSDLLRDPQYEHRKFYREHEHSEMGLQRYAGHQFRIRGYDSGPRTAAPVIGQHNFEVLADVLGYGAEEIAELIAAGAIE
jgi:benzylsuccinate CoA-transferase BbsF subunit